MSSWRRPILAVAITACAVVLAGGYQSHPSVRLLRSLYPNRVRLTAEDLRRSREGLGQLSELSFRTKDGIVLSGWYVPPRNNAVIVLVHGGFANRAQLLPEAAALVSHGFGVLLYDSRASGESSGHLMTWGDREQLDLEAAVDAVVAAQGNANAHIGVQGFSIGATTAALTAAHDKRIEAVLLNAVWSSLEDEIVSKSSSLIGARINVALFRMAGVDVAATNVISQIAQISPRSLLMLVGDKDVDTPPEISLAVFKVAGHPKALSFVKGAGHGGYAAADSSYLEHVVDFFEHALAVAHE